ncbi:GNAT family N-acetyltransferase [Brevibacillus sp. SYP-B805]|uniref:GNAT family N-acetyltransferase n=1 Tax=Brevibacillus sp. SYP-B805 TaxID=1578199 RepID=UPI0013ED0E82|nr:GNAT family N-acetyltransferase [Brevibacillus sp. SYP-B805]NGQ94694.1 GNAT family N-acetyltransferase [Brevibacillus sp. SYP-B805]
MKPLSPFAQIQTERLILRTPRPGDEHAIFAIHAHPETNQHNPAGPMKDLSEAQQRLSRWMEDWSVHGIGYWCISTRNDPQVIGVSGVRVMEWSGRQVLNLYYRYVPDAWGKGYATEAAKEAVKAANRHLPALPVVARTRPTNISSMRVAERAGLVRRPELDTAEHVVYAIGW